MNPKGSPKIDREGSENIDQLKKRIAELEAENQELISDKKIRQAVDQAVDAVITIDHNNSIIYFNDAAESLFGYTRDEVIGKNVKSIAPLEHRHNHYCYISNNRDTGVNKVVGKGREEKMVRKDGSSFIGQLTLSKVEFEDGFHYTAFIKDITQIKKYEDILKEQSTKLAHANTILQNVDQQAKVGYWEVDTLTKKATWSKETREIHEAPHDFEPDVESAISFYKEGKNRNTVRRVYEESIQTGNSFDVELEIVSYKGNSKWIRAIGTPEMKNGKCIRVYGTFQDITARKETESELEKITLVASQVDSGIMIATPDRELIWTNKALETMTQYSKEDLIGGQLKTLIVGPKTDLGTVRYIENKIKNKQSFRRELILHRKDKTTFWAELGMTPVLDDNGNIERFIGILTDISKRKEAEFQLKRNEERIQNIANSIPGVLFVYQLNADQTDQLNFISDGVVDLWEISKDEALADVSLLWADIHPDDLPEMQKSVMYSAETLTFWNHTYRINTRSGKTKWVNGRGFPVAHEDGSIVWNTMVIDINPLKEAERSLQEALNQKNTLLKELHHRIKNNLQLISSILYLKSASEKESKLQEFITETNSRVKSIAKIHNQLLLLEEVDHLDIDIYLASLSRELVDNMAEHPEKYTLDIQIPNIKIHIDKVLSLGLITNEIISNCIKHAYPSEVGGIIYVRLQKDNNKFHFEIYDEGEVKKPNLSTDNGTLGLTLVKTLAAQLGAKMEIDTSKGVKYSFSFY
ncbi:MAG: hypothetical protein Tsb0034_26820 [Ekhidna sp.]